MRLIIFALYFFIPFSLHAELSILPDAPKRYVVQPGDTLWSIAGNFLRNPWEWKALWHNNPKIHNPNRLYPGAILELNYSHRNPYIRVLSNGTVKLSPFIRAYPAEDPVPAIPLTEIKPFLNQSVVLDANKLATAPYIVAFNDEHLLGGQGDEVFVKNLHPCCDKPTGKTITYAIYRPECPYGDPKTKILLGYKASIIGYAELVQGGEPATILLTDIFQGVELRDRVLPNKYPEFNLYFEPKAPNQNLCGSIIDILGDFKRGAVGLVTTINLGRNAGVEPGDVLGIYSRERLVPDPIKSGIMIRLPKQRIGELMIFRVFSQTSFALVIRSVRAVHLKDIVTNP